VKVLEIGDDGKIRLTRRGLLEGDEDYVAPPSAPRRESVDAAEIAVVVEDRRMAAAVVLVAAVVDSDHVKIGRMKLSRKQVVTMGRVYGSVRSSNSPFGTYY